MIDRRRRVSHAELFIGRWLSRLHCKCLFKCHFWCALQSRELETSCAVWTLHNLAFWYFDNSRMKADSTSKVSRLRAALTEPPKNRSHNLRIRFTREGASARKKLNYRKNTQIAVRYMSGHKSFCANASATFTQPKSRVLLLLLHWEKISIWRWKQKLLNYLNFSVKRASSTLKSAFVS